MPYQNGHVPSINVNGDGFFFCERQATRITGKRKKAVVVVYISQNQDVESYIRDMMADYGGVLQYSCYCKQLHLFWELTFQFCKLWNVSTV